MNSTGVRTLGSYQILTEIGRGAYGIVYKAWQAAPWNRHVALKVLLARPGDDDPATVKRFQQEAMFTARLNHPHIVPVYDAGFADGCYYIAMEYLSGGSLTDLMRSGKADLPTLLKLLCQIGEALEFAHKSGLVAHRDAKPSNILLTADQQCAKLSDFGIAVLARGAIVSSSGSSAIGTPAYMSPEQIQPNVRVDARSDVYSFGVMLYQVCTGRLPFVADDPYAVGMMHLTQRPVSPRQINPQIDRKLESVILKCLEKQREDRFQSVAEVVKTIQLRHGMAERKLDSKIASLIEALGSASEKTRRSAVENLIKIGRPAVEPVIARCCTYLMGPGNPLTLGSIPPAVVDDILMGIGEPSVIPLVRIWWGAQELAWPGIMKRCVAPNLLEHLQNKGVFHDWPLYQAHLDDPDPFVRIYAARKSGVTDALMPLLGHQDLRVSIRAALLLAKTGDREAVDTLVANLGHPDSMMRQARVFEATFSWSGDPRRDWFIENLAVRSVAAEFLKSIGDRRVVELLIRALNDPDHYVREAAVITLGEIGDQTAVGHLIHMLQNDPVPSVRRLAAKALDQIGDTRALTPLVEALEDSDRYVRKVAAESLGKLGSVWAVGPLIHALGDPDPEVRLPVIENLSRLGSTSALESLIQALNDSDAEVREAAISAVVNIGGEHAVESVISTLVCSPIGNVRQAAIEVLGRIGDTRAAEPLIRSLSDPDVDVRRAAASALENIKDVKAAEPLISALSDSDADVRRAVAYALGAIRDIRAAEPLIHALGDSDRHVRRAAAWSLGAIGDHRAVGPLIRALGDPDGDVRCTIATALGAIGDSRAVEPLISALSDLGGDAYGAIASSRNPGRVLHSRLVREEAALALGHIGDMRALPFLRWIAQNDGEDHVCTVAQKAIQQIESHGRGPSMTSE